MKKLYICHTPYHLLIAIVKQLIEKNRSDLVLCREELIGEDVIYRLKNHNIFDNIFSYHNLDSRRELRKRAREVLVHRREMNHEIEQALHMTLQDLKKYDIYIFTDNSTFGYWLNMNGIKYHLLEDGLNCFKLFKHSKDYSTIERIQKLLRQLLRVDFAFWGESANYISIEVNDVDGIQINHKEKLIEIPRRDLFHQLSETDRNTIRDIFLGQDTVLLENGQTLSTLVITEPLSEDFVVSHEIKLKIYRYLIDTYGVGQVFIKPHPRDTDLYENFQDCVVISRKNVPLEVLDFSMDFSLKRAITCSSTSIQELENVEEKIIMGVDWIDQFAKRYCKN